VATDSPSARDEALASTKPDGAVSPPTPTLAPSILEILSDPSIQADKKSAFRTLYARWGVDAHSIPTAVCERGQPQGLRCLYRTGTWAKLRRIDLPAIIELTSPSWERRYATVVALDDKMVTLDFGGRRFTLPLSAVDKYWDGPFVVLWRGPALNKLSIEPGARSKDVEWVRQRLSDLDGGPIVAKDRDVFDDRLRARVITFQRSRSLEPDGIVGEETLAHLSLTPRDPRVPRLSRSKS
jgi:general secretion pathway protein A